jgi:hypothetical protein
MPNSKRSTMDMTVEAAISSMRVKEGENFFI